MGWIVVSQAVQVGQRVEENEQEGTLAFKVVHER
jgi:hypothetical protein